MAHAPAHLEHQLSPTPPRQRLLAQRLLRGEGSVEVTAYRDGETLTSAAHGVAGTGQIVLAHVPNLFGSIGAFHTAEDIEVRVDILQAATDLMLPLRTASVHLLDPLRWCRDTDEVQALGLRGHLADLLDDVGPRLRVGVVQTQRILLHDSSGVTAFCEHSLPLAATGLFPAEEIADLTTDVQSTPVEVLADLADAVGMGLLPGTLSEVDLGAAPGLSLAAAHVTDVDEQGVSLLRVREGEGHAVYVPLPGGGRLDHSPRDAWHALVQSLPARWPVA